MSSSFRSKWYMWPLMPIASVVGGMACSILFTLIATLSLNSTWPPNNSLLSTGVINLIGAGVLGYVYTWLSAYIAPSGKFVAAVVMLSIFSLLLLLAFLNAWFSAGTSLGDGTKATIYLVGFVGGGLAALSSGTWK